MNRCKPRTHAIARLDPCRADVAMGRRPVFDLIQCGERPERYGEFLRLDTMPSSPSLQACANTSGPSSLSRCSLKRRPGAARASRLTSVALRTASGSRRRSSPFSSIRSKAYRNALASWWRYRMWSKDAMPFSSHTTASPSHREHVGNGRCRSAEGAIIDLLALDFQLQTV